MTNFQLYQQISALPFDLKQDVINFIKHINSPNSRGIQGYDIANYMPHSYLSEPEVAYQKPFLDLLLNGPTFTEGQLQKITDSLNL